MTVVGLLHPGEMEKIGRSMRTKNMPAGFHEAVAEVFRRTAEDS